MLNDPSGNNPCRSDYLCKRRAEKLEAAETTHATDKTAYSGMVAQHAAYQQADPGLYCRTHPGACGGNASDPYNPLDSTIRIGFGKYVDGKFVGQGGLGTVVGDRYTIYTALHVYYEGYFWYRPGSDADPIRVNMNQKGFRFEYYGGDVLIIHLPFALPSQFIPAQVLHHSFNGGEDVSVAYWDDHTASLDVLETQIRTDNTYKPGLYGGLGTTVYNPWDLTINDQENYQMGMNSGDSGGGVFYNGYFIGVNSFVDGDGPGKSQGFMVFAQP